MIQQNAVFLLNDKLEGGEEICTLCIDMQSNQISRIILFDNNPLDRRRRIVQRLLPQVTGAFVDKILKINAHLWLIDFRGKDILQNFAASIVLSEIDHRSVLWLARQSVLTILQ